MELYNKIFDILTKISGKRDIYDESMLQEDLALDSLQMVMLLVELEESFEIVLDESDMNPFDLITVHDVVMLVGKYCGESCE